MGKSQGVQRGDIGWVGFCHGVKYNAEHRRQFAVRGCALILTDRRLFYSFFNNLEEAQQ